MQGKAGQRGDSGEDGEGYGIANGRYQGAGKQRTGDDTDIDVELAPAGGLRRAADTFKLPLDSDKTRLSSDISTTRHIAGKILAN